MNGRPRSKCAVGVTQQSSQSQSTLLRQLSYNLLFEDRDYPGAHTNQTPDTLLIVAHSSYVGCRQCTNWVWEKLIRSHNRTGDWSRTLVENMRWMDLLSCGVSSSAKYFSLRISSRGVEENASTPGKTTRWTIDCLMGRVDRRSKGY